MTDYTNVCTRAMLVSLHISTWTARKYDKKVSDKVNADANANANAGRFNKHLLAGVKAHEEVIKQAGIARDIHYAETLPWSDEGRRLLPTTNYMNYMAKMRVQRAKFETSLADFFAQYPDLRTQAPTNLGKLWKAADWPSLKLIQHKFGLSIDVEPVPARGDFRLDLPADQLAVIEAQMQDKAEASARTAMRDAWGRLYSAVARIEKAASPDGIVRGTVIDNARNVIDTLARLNVAESAELDTMCHRVEQELGSIDPEDLRNDDKLRKDTAKRAADIMAAMGAFYAPAQQQTEDEAA